MRLGAPNLPREESRRQTPFSDYDGRTPLREPPCQLSQDEQVSALYSFDRLQRYLDIERDELPAVTNREREQIEIRKLTRPIDPRRIRGSRIEQTHVVRPELVNAVCARFPKSFDD